jgi:hypothetical protein
MTEKAIDLDRHRGMAAQKVPELRRLQTRLLQRQRPIGLKLPTRHAIF